MFEQGLGESQRHFGRQKRNGSDRVIHRSRSLKILLQNMQQRSETAGSCFVHTDKEIQNKTQKCQRAGVLDFGKYAPNGKHSFWKNKTAGTSQDVKSGWTTVASALCIVSELRGKGQSDE